MRLIHAAALRAALAIGLRGLEKATCHVFSAGHSGHCTRCPRLARAWCASRACSGDAGSQVTLEIPIGPEAVAGETAHPLDGVARNPHLERTGERIRARRAWLVAAAAGSNLHHAAVIQTIWVLLL